MVDVTPGDSGANKGFWRQQLRDRFGKFVEMGGGVVFETTLQGVSGIVRAKGKFVGMVDPETARIEVTDSSEIPKGVYLIKRDFIEAINAKAILSKDYVDKKLGNALETPAEVPSQLKQSISGSEALKIRLKSIAKHLKAEGRFPVPRLAPTTDKGQNSDVAKGAKLDYKKVFDAEPALQQKYKTAENMWETVYKYGADERTQSPNELADIPEDMKELNRAYAKHILGLDPDGFITVYRNAVNGKDTPEESAIGYVSLDREMAYDYNSHRDNVGANGRYEIDVKPDEVFGMIGYSKIEDEYGLTIGREMTNILGRVRRVGDLEIVDIEAPWLRDYGRNEFNRGRGASPFRMFNIAGEYDFHPVEPFGNNLEEFLQKYNLSSSQIKEKFEELYGQGSYDRYKASGNIVTFQKIRDLFVQLEDGKIGFDVSKFNRLDALRNPNDYLHDIYDNTLKMLSVFQELTGQHFMTHKTRDYTPPTQERKEEAVEAVDVDKSAEIILPPKPRETPIPEGHVRLFHYTNESAVESIRKNGLQAQKDGAAVADDNVSLIWASEDAPINGDKMFNERPIVEFHVPEEVWAKGAGLGFERTAMAGPVSADNIVAVHEPWHFHAREALENMTPEEIISRFGDRDLSFIGQIELRVGIEAAVKIAKQTLAERGDTDKAEQLPIETKPEVVEPEATPTPDKKSYASVEDLVQDATELQELYDETYDSSISKEANGNIAIRILLESLGKGGKPEIVSSIDDLDGDPIYRGAANFTHQSMINSLSDRVGLGQYGDGYYFSNLEETADGYAQMAEEDGSVIVAGLKKDAKIFNFSGNIDWVDKSVDAQSDAVKKLNMDGGSKDPTDEQDAIFWLFYEDYATSLVTDLILKGYDGFTIGDVNSANIGETYTVVFNREALQIVSI